MEKVSLSIYVLGCLFCLVNIYTSWLRYPIHKYVFKKPDDEFKFVSGIPLLGSVFIVLALFLYSGNAILFWLGVVLALLDTGGIHWFIGTIIYASVTDKNT